ncbi:MAG: hypothetical protein LBR55_03360, partial [Bacteroidales bacterium]|nr:hypothetical protein [Bacteroidales bacterium]
MKRSEFLSTMATIPAVASVPNLSVISESDAGKIKITDVKFMRIQINGRGHVMPLVRIETDSGVYGIGECHHDVTGLGAKDVVLNAFRQILISQDPFDIERLVQLMKWRISYLGGNGGIGMHAVTGCEIALWDLVGKLLNMPLRKILGGGCFTNKVRAYLTSQPRNMLDLSVCREWIDYVNNSVQKWTAAKPFRISRRPGGSELNRRLTNA